MTFDDHIRWLAEKLVGVDPRRTPAAALGHIELRLKDSSGSVHRAVVSLSPALAQVSLERDAATPPEAFVSGALEDWHRFLNPSGDGEGIRALTRLAIRGRSDLVVSLDQLLRQRQSPLAIRLGR